MCGWRVAGHSLRSQWISSIKAVLVPSHRALTMKSRFSPSLQRKKESCSDHDPSQPPLPNLPTYLCALLPSPSRHPLPWSRDPAQHYRKWKSYPGITRRRSDRVFLPRHLHLHLLSHISHLPATRMSPPVGMHEAISKPNNEWLLCLHTPTRTTINQSAFFNVW